MTPVEHDVLQKQCSKKKHTKVFHPPPPISKNGFHPHISGSAPDVYVIVYTVFILGVQI